MDYLATVYNGVMVLQDDSLVAAKFALAPLANISVAAPYTLTFKDCGKLIHNKGGVGAASTRIVTLPKTTSAKINGTFFSLIYEFCDYSGLGIQVQCNTGQQIAIGDLNSICISGGYIINRLQYNRIKLMLLDTGIWIADPNPNWLVQTS